MNDKDPDDSVMGHEAEKDKLCRCLASEIDNSAFQGTSANSNKGLSLAYKVYGIAASKVHKNKDEFISACVSLLGLKNISYSVLEQLYIFAVKSNITTNADTTNKNKSTNTIGNSDLESNLNGNTSMKSTLENKTNINQASVSTIKPKFISSSKNKSRNFARKIYSHEENEDEDDDNDTFIPNKNIDEKIVIKSGLSSVAKEKLLEIRAKRLHSKSNESKTRTTTIKSTSKSMDNFKSQTDENIQSKPTTDDIDLDDLSPVAGDENYNPFGSSDYDTTYSVRLQADSQAEDRIFKRMSAFAQQKQQDNNLWENNQLAASGHTVSSLANENSSSDLYQSGLFLTYNPIPPPPFLDGHIIFTQQKDPISVFRVPDSDMAVFSRKGSALVRAKRVARERAKQAKSAASIQGTTLGNVLQVTDSTESDSIDAKDKVDKETNEKEDKTVFEKAENKEIPNDQITRYSLPAYEVREKLLRIIRENQIVVVVGETGSGKTTQLTQFLHEDGYTSHGLRIGCTQPRRVAAISVAKRVAQEMDVSLGAEVGYAVRFDDCTSPSTIIKYMTDGVLLRECLNFPDLDKYACIIIDEAHERTLNTDILLGLLKKIFTRRRDLKLIVTSATINADRFSKFFGDAPQFVIPGRTHPVDVLYSKWPCEDYVESAVQQVLAIHLQSASLSGDILVFMTGQEDIEVCCEVLAERLALLHDPPKLEILPIFSQLPPEQQVKIFKAASKGMRKCIVATNIAETSLTVGGVKYVIDTGYAKLKVYNPRLGMDMLQVAIISQANANQRSGRAGRTQPGTAYRLYTHGAYENEMYPQTIPEIQRTNLSNTILLLKSLHVDDLLTFDFLDPPPKDIMTSSLYELWALGALDNKGQLTRLGSQMSAFPMEPSLSKLLIMSMTPEFGCSLEMLTIVSMLSVQSVFYRSKERQEQADAAREKFFVPESDHLTLLNVYNQWESNRRNERWCEAHFLHSKSLYKAAEIRSQLKDIMEKRRSGPNTLVSCGADENKIRKCICSAYFHQAAKLKNLGEYINLRTSVPVSLHPTSALYGVRSLPEYIVYHELVLTSKAYMSTVTAVDPLWLCEVGAVFYAAKIRENSSKRHKQLVEFHTSNRERLEREIDDDREFLNKKRLQNALSTNSSGVENKKNSASLVNIGTKRLAKRPKRRGF